MQWPLGINKEHNYYRDYCGFCREEYLAVINQVNWPEIIMLHFDWSSWDDKGMHKLDERSCQEPCAFIDSKQSEDVATHQTMADTGALKVNKKETKDIIHVFSTESQLW